VKYEGRIFPIPQERLAEAVGLLVRAFRDDPLMRYLYGDTEEGYAARLRAVFRYQCDLHQLQKWPLIGIEPRSRLAGLVGVRPPRPPRRPDELAARFEALEERIGVDATERLAAYAAISNTHLPDEPLLYVGMIAVRPESQGRGYARALLDHVHGLAERDPSAVGVGLDTENPDNLPFYEHLGYRIVGTGQLEGLAVWSLFRPNPR